MNVEIKKRASGDIKSVKITIGEKFFHITERFEKLYIRVNGKMIITPCVQNVAEIDCEPDL